MVENLIIEDFIKEWLEHFNLIFNQDIKINSELSLSYHIPSLNIGVLIIDWKRPISIQIVNKAIQILRELKLTTLYLISKEISDPAQKNLMKYGEGIIPIQPNGISEIAVDISIKLKYLESQIIM